MIVEGSDADEFESMHVFFFQAEDGIRDRDVTGGRVLFRSLNTAVVQGNPGCAARGVQQSVEQWPVGHGIGTVLHGLGFARSEERRVGKECRRWRDRLAWLSFIPVLGLRVQV